MIRSLVLLALILAARPAAALEAVGRVNVGGYNRTEMCSGTLVRPEIVLTAAHCVADWRDGYAKRTGDMVFVAGWSGRGHAGAARVASVSVHPRAFADGRLDLEHDLALIVLRRPIDITGLRVGVAAPEGPFRLEGYASSSPNRVTTATGCRARPRDGIWRLSCRVEKGQSGGPVLFGTGDALRVVAVIVGQAEGAALAVPVDGWLRRELARVR